MIKNKLFIRPCGNLQEYVDENGCVWIRYRSEKVKFLVNGIKKLLT